MPCTPIGNRTLTKRGISGPASEWLNGTVEDLQFKGTHQWWCCSWSQYVALYWWEGRAIPPDGDAEVELKIYEIAQDLVQLEADHFELLTKLNCQIVGSGGVVFTMEAWEFGGTIDINPSAGTYAAGSYLSAICHVIRETAPPLPQAPMPSPGLDSWIDVTSVLGAVVGRVKFTGLGEPPYTAFDFVAEIEWTMGNLDHFLIQFPVPHIAQGVSFVAYGDVATNLDVWSHFDGPHMDYAENESPYSAGLGAIISFTWIASNVQGNTGGGGGND